MTLVTIAQTGPKPWGVLMLDTQFPRWMGDIGCPDGWPVELRYRKVKGVFPKEIVRSSETLQQHDVLPLFVQAAEDLLTQGVGGITTSCGFLVLLQNELQSRLPVPVFTSSLLLLPQLLAENAAVGVLTMDEHALGDAQLKRDEAMQKIGDGGPEALQQQQQKAAAAKGSGSRRQNKVASAMPKNITRCSQISRVASSIIANRP